MSRDVVVAAGEVSGDRISAGICAELGRLGVRTFGLAGAASARAGAELVADLARSTAMGTSELVGRLGAVARAYVRVLATVRRRRPCAAVLVDYTEFNVRLGRALRARGIPVLWCIAPQIWAWRPKRAPSVARSLDRLAVVLPFEEPLWRSHGVDACYVGHPALESRPLARDAARALLKLDPRAPALALMPGSRPHEVAVHLPILLRAFERVRAARPAVEGRVLLAPSVAELGRLRAGDAITRGGPLRAVTVDASAGAAPLLPAFDAAIVTSGTATLECALAAAHPVIVYRASALTAALARRMLTIDRIGLPNVLLEEHFYAELLQSRCEPGSIARAALDALDAPDRARDGAARLRARLATGAARAPGAEAPAATVAQRTTAMLSSWIDP